MEAGGGRSGGENDGPLANLPLDGEGSSHPREILKSVACLAKGELLFVASSLLWAGERALLILL
jgi:hypothetical protein